MEVIRPDLINPRERLPASIAQQYPLLGSKPDGVTGLEALALTPRIHFVEVTDKLVDPSSLIDQIEGKDIIIYCSNWGSGEKGISGFGRVIEDDINRYVGSEEDTDLTEINEHLGMVMTTIAAVFHNSDKQFRVAGDFEPFTDEEEADLSRQDAYREMINGVLGFLPVEEQLYLIEDFAQKSATYNNLVSQLACEQIKAILNDNPTSSIAVVMDSTFQALPRFFVPDPNNPIETSTTYSYARTAWDSVLRNVILYRPIEQIIGEPDEVVKLINDRDPQVDAQRFWIDQIMYLKQLGQNVPKYFFYNAFYSLVDYILMAPDSSKAGTGAEYNSTSDHENVIHQSLVAFKIHDAAKKHFTGLRKAIEEGGHESEEFTQRFKAFALYWLQYDMS